MASEPQRIRDGTSIEDEAIPLEDRRMLILYGSETGNSQDLAEDLGRLAERLHFQVLVGEMNDVELTTLLQYPLTIFVISTTGQGELPKNTLRFWKSLLRKRLPPDCLQSLNFTTFGLGDSSYSKYNWAAKKLHKRLSQLGATEFFPRGEADERHEDGIDGTFLPWSLSLHSHLLQEYPLPQGLSPIPSDVQLSPKFTIELAPTMDSPDKPMSDRDKPQDEVAGIADPTSSTSLPGTDVTSQSHQQIHQEQVLDRTAALFSHVDTPHPRGMELALRSERMSPYSDTYAARLSEHTASLIQGGIDTLDRPNVLRDDPEKYSLEVSASAKEVAPPPDLLPIPDAWLAVVHDNHRVTPNTHWQDVRLITLGVQPRASIGPTEKKDYFAYLPGDTVVLYPKNFPADVQALIDLMGWQDVADIPLEHHGKQNQGLYSRPRNCFPLSNSTLRQLLLNNYDINAIPKRIFFHDIAFYTVDSMHRERLREFANPGHSDEFYDYTSRPRRSILEVLHDFPSVKIPYQHVPSIFPTIRGREYSIASGGKLIKSRENVECARVELLVALVKYKTVLRKTRQGLCSRYVESLSPGTNIMISHRQRDSLNPGLHHKPLLAIAPGTGIAPVRAYLWDRLQESPAGPVAVFFGGRNRKADFYFENEWAELQAKVFTAFSRDQKEKIYVQDRIREQAPLVCQYIERGAIICICGSSGKMPEAVRLALYDAMVAGQLVPDREAAKAWLSTKNLIWEEVW
ncbi:riboflavin synthase domain-like protein [Durotheca rogersii]|uniref:riboflavin synthase domain-like protein n=1 Tax=Durotheca rogersii TaxID=419775 RepID=UPI002220DACB|nr:riboflavin synthase domain-like protein [Durotheca rogersii]KAI5868432.1 riboflavin synthase domain-like protein [Durotheca rogersii]